MFNKLFERPHAIKRQLTGPFLEVRERYLRTCADQGAARTTLRRIAQYLLIIIDLLGLETRKTVTVQEIKTAADRWAGRQPKHPKMKGSFSRVTRLRFIRDATDWLRFAGRLQLPQAPPRPFGLLITEYSNYMKLERGLSPETIRHRCLQVEDFLNRICDSHPLNQMTISQIDEALAQKGIRDGYGRRTIQTYASALRSFFRYAEVRGWCRHGLADAIRAPRVYRDETLPSSPTWEDVQHLLAGTEGDQPTDIRDRAILMLFAVYGLRRGEVRQLRLENLDWENEIIHLTRSKSFRPQQLPLSHTVGEAILRYLKEVRPHCSFREVFLSMRAPLRPLSGGALFQIVSRRWNPLNVPIKHHGPHSLRHACATHLINQGVSLKEIGDHLGHRNVETTRIYAKVDLTRLREVANFNLGGLI